MFIPWTNSNMQVESVELARAVWSDKVNRCVHIWLARTTTDFSKRTVFILYVDSTFQIGFSRFSDAYRAYDGTVRKARNGRGPSYWTN